VLSYRHFYRVDVSEGKFATLLDPIFASPTTNGWHNLRDFAELIYPELVCWMFGFIFVIGRQWVVILGYISMPRSAASKWQYSGIVVLYMSKVA
jgi:hypothetical protein